VKGQQAMNTDKLRLEVMQLFATIDAQTEEISSLKKELAETKEAIMPQGNALLSYVNKNGEVKLPPAIISFLGLENGGGVVIFVNEDNVVEISTNETFLDKWGGEE
jgi:hypothetical protein